MIKTCSLPSKNLHTSEGHIPNSFKNDKMSDMRGQTRGPKGAYERDPSPNLWSRKGFPEKSTPELSLKTNPNYLREEGWKGNHCRQNGLLEEKQETLGHVQKYPAGKRYQNIQCSGRWAAKKVKQSREAQGLVCCAKRLALCSPCDRGMSKGVDMCGFGLEGSLWLQSEGIGLGMG